MFCRVNVRTTSLVNSSTEKNAVARRASSAERYTSTSQVVGSASNPTRRRVGLRNRAAESRRPPREVDAGCTVLVTLRAPGSAVLDAAPRLAPLRIRDALHVRAAVEAVGLRRRPEPDLLEVALVLGVERLAVR